MYPQLLWEDNRIMTNRTPFEHEEVPEDELEKAQLEVILARRAYRQDPDSGAERLLAAFDALLALLDQPEEEKPYTSADDVRREREKVFSSRPLLLETWQDHPDPPPREWLVDAWLPANRVSLFWGIAGSGKSRLALQLAAGMASGGGEDRRWVDNPGGLMPLGRTVPAGRGLTVVFCSWEDESEEFGRRFSAIHHPDKAHWVTPDRTSALYITNLAGRGPLWSPEQGRHTSTLAELTDAGAAVRRAAERMGAQLLVLDPLAAVYAANENDRGLVRSFVADWDAWAQEAKCAVLLLAHPNKEGNQSGSTDWRGACRSVWELVQQLHGPQPQKGEPDNRTHEWKLELGKSNYGPRPPALLLKWDGTRGERWRIEGLWEDPAGIRGNQNGDGGFYESRLI